MKILFLSRWFPFPPDNGSKIRIYHLLRGLAQHHDVTLISFSDLPLPSPKSLENHPICSEIRVVPWKSFNENSAKARLGYFSLLPRSLVDTHSPQMESSIRTALAKNKFDLVIASQLSMAAYYPSFKGMPALFDEVELGLFYKPMFDTASVTGRIRAGLSWYKLKFYLFRLLNAFDACTVVSEREYQILTGNFQKHADKIEIMSNLIDLQDYVDLNIARKPKHLIFSGSFSYRPNYQAMLWFIHHVFPLVLRQVPNAHLIITGDQAGLPPPTMMNITHAGYVDDIRSLVASCDISIAPLWTGGGTRLKILEAMAAGTPVVATSQGAEGLLVQDGEHILIANDPERFAEHVVKLLCDPHLREYISSNAMQLVKERYDLQVILPGFLRLANKITSRSIVG